MAKITVALVTHSVETHRQFKAVQKWWAEWRRGYEGRFPIVEGRAVFVPAWEELGLPNPPHKNW